MGLLPLNHFDDPPQLSLQVVLLSLKRIMCQRLSRTQGLSRTQARTHAHTHKLTHMHTHTHTASQTVAGCEVTVEANLQRKEVELQPNERRLQGNESDIVI